MTNADEAGLPRIVVGIDGSEQSKLALRWAARLAAPLGASIEAVAAWDFPASYGWSAVPSDWDPAQDMKQVLTETVDAVFGQERPDRLDMIIQEGGPAGVLLERSKEALMVVVGSRGRGGFTGLLLGSVSASVAEHASCPVLVVHDEAAPPQ